MLPEATHSRFTLLIHSALSYFPANIRTASAPARALTTFHPPHAHNTPRGIKVSTSLRHQLQLNLHRLVWARSRRNREIKMNGASGMTALLDTYKKKNKLPAQECNFFLLPCWYIKKNFILFSYIVATLVGPYVFCAWSYGPSSCIMKTLCCIHCFYALQFLNCVVMIKWQ